MENEDLSNKVSETVILAAKQLPVVGQVISVLDELGDIWIPDNNSELTDAFRTERLLEDFVQRLSPVMTRIEKLDNTALEHEINLTELENSLNNRTAELRALLANVPVSKSHQRLRQLLKSSWIELGVEAWSFNDDLRIISEKMDDTCLWILLWLDDHPDWNPVTPDDLARPSKYATRRLYMALRTLDDAGIIHERGFSPELISDSEAVPYGKREFFVDLKEVRNLVKSLYASPMVAAVPDLSLAGYASMKETGRFPSSISPDTLRLTAIAVVRRHLFEGYQWKLPDSSKSWHGKEPTADAAIKQATQALIDNGIQHPRWVSCPIGFEQPDAEADQRA